MPNSQEKIDLKQIPPIRHNALDGSVLRRTRWNLVAERIVPAVLGLRHAEQQEIRLFLEWANTKGLDAVRSELRNAFEDFLPTAWAEMAPRETTLATSFAELERVLQNKNLTRKAFDQLAEAMFDKSLKQLADAIMKREIGGMAPVVFYSPEMRSELRSFIKTVQKAYEARGDVTGKEFRISFVSTNRAELRKFQTELAQAGLGRGIDFYPWDGTDAGWHLIQGRLNARVFGNPVLNQSYGIFFPEIKLDGHIPWQRVVRNRVPGGCGVILARMAPYLAKTTTVNINAITLKQAAPDLSGVFEFRPGEGLWIVASVLLNVIANAERQISASA